MIKGNNIFEDLFVLEVANNHWGSLKRGFEIINQYSRIIKKYKVKAAFKLQIRDVESFVHKKYKGSKNIRYINKTERTRLKIDEFTKLVNFIRKKGHIVSATPFDEKSVKFCKKLNVSIIKIASSDISDITLIDEILKLKKPTIVSTGGAEVHEVDNVYRKFKNKNIPLAINHCVSLYPSEDKDLSLGDITFLKNRFPKNIIGFSTHEYNDWEKSLCIAYGIGARTFERHIDIQNSKHNVSKYCSLPHQIDTWFKCFKKIKEMIGSQKEKRKIQTNERQYLNKLLRGFYAKRNLPKNYVLSKKNLNKDFYLSIPLLKSQISSNDRIDGIKTKTKILKDHPILNTKVKISKEEFMFIKKRNV